MRRLGEDACRALVRAAADGCCMDGPWRGHACHYHLGYADGMEAMADALAALNDLDIPEHKTEEG